MSKPESCRFCGSSTDIHYGHSSSIYTCRDVPACWQRERQQAEERERRLVWADAAEAFLRERTEPSSTCGDACNPLPGEDCPHEVEAAEVVALLEPAQPNAEGAK